MTPELERAEPPLILHLPDSCQKSPPYCGSSSPEPAAGVIPHLAQGLGTSDCWVRPPPGLARTHDQGPGQEPHDRL